ncbi:MAG: HPr family phosphocarrier protein [Deltaproteobacteria bacterium]|nr:HPr family phosphocarrier protein [Deltaproteobacteria bacterium]
MVEKTFRIKNRLGLHARAASKFVNLTGKYSSEIFVKKGDHEVNGKSIMGILILAAACGTDIVVKADGKDENEAIAAVGALVESGFGED